jgi:hypothetical protein
MRGMERAFERRGEMYVFPELRAALERIIANEDIELYERSANKQ